MKAMLAIDRPRSGVPLRRYGGWLEVSGWAAAAEPVREIRARADGGEWSRAVWCQPRPDVKAAHPKLVAADRSGFQAFVQAPPTARRIEVAAFAGDKRTQFGATVDVSRDVRVIDVADTRAAACPWCGFASTRCEDTVARGPFRLLRCGRCDFGFAEPLPAAHALAAIYETEYWDHSPYGPDVLSPSHDTGLVAAFAERFGNRGRRVLEVGCGQGSLLFGLQQRGFTVRGQDLSRNSARALQQKHGVQIWREPLATIATDERFDCIVARHVLEHSVTPRADLCWMRDHLAPGGIVVLLTPNHRSLAADLLGSTWEWFVPPIHVGYFSPRSMQFTGEAAGLTLLSCTTREGDGAPLVPTLRAFVDYERERLPAWRHQQCLDVLAAARDGTDPLMAAGGGAAGLGQELIVVLAVR